MSSRTNLKDLKEMHNVIEGYLDKFSTNKTQIEFPVIQGKQYFLKLAQGKRAYYLKNEILILKKLEGIIPFYKKYNITSYEKDGKIGIMHKFLKNGTDLTPMLKSSFKVSLEDSLAIYNILLKKLKILHDNSINHGDIKAGNIVVTPSGNGKHEFNFIDLESSNDFSDKSKKSFINIESKDYKLPNIITKNEFPSFNEAFLFYKYQDIYAVSLLILYIYNYDIFKKNRDTSGWNLCKRHPKKVVENKKTLIHMLLFYVFSFLPEHTGKNKIQLQFGSEKNIPDLDKMIYILENKNKLDRKYIEKIYTNCPSQFDPIE